MRLKLASFTVAVAGLLAVQSAIAADMAVKAPAAPVVRAMSWTGCYVGAGGGYGMWNQDNNVFTAAGVADSNTQTAGGRGWFGTAQGGCDYQFTTSWGDFVVGAFGDYDFSSIKGQLGTLDFGRIGEEKLTSKWAAGGRLGYVVFPKLLAYTSGGYTEARFADVNFTGPLGGPVINTMAAQTYHGWFMGTGYEYGFSFMPNLFWKTEYRFAQYQSERNTVLTVPAGTAFLLDSKKYTQEIRSELVWRFNWR